MKFFTFLSLSATCLCTSFTTFAGSSPFFDALDGQFDASQYLSENAYGFLPVPVIITDPAVDGGLGMVGLFFHEDDEDRDSRLDAMKNNDSDASMHLIPPSVSAAFGAYTGNGSYFLGGGHMGFFKQGAIRYMGGAGYGDVKLDFYGAGDITLPSPVEINTQASGLMQSVKFKVLDTPFFIGPTQRFVKSSISPSRSNDFIANLPPEWQDELVNVLTKDITLSSLGLTVEYDSRDNFFSPQTGLKYELNYLWFDDTLSSDIDFTLTELSALHYFRIAKKWRTNFRAEVNYANANGILPPFVTPSISLRGIPAARYQGQSVAMSELELVYEINMRWEVNAFAGIGKASNEFSDLNDSNSRITQGAGFRYLIARKYGFNMGIDVAKGPEDNVFYIQAGSAW